MADVTIFSCIGGRRVVCDACGNRAISRCTFALGGRKAGMKCDAPLCPRCQHGSPERPRCRAHHHFEQRQGLGSAPAPAPETFQAPAGLPATGWARQASDAAVRASRGSE